MADYHTTLQKLEELITMRLELIGRGSSHNGVDKGINFEISRLLQVQTDSVVSRAEEYCRRLKIIRNRLGGYATLELHQLINQQEYLLPHARPNVSKPRSPPPPPLFRPQRRSAQVVNDATTPGVAGGRVQPPEVVESDAPPLIRPRARYNAQPQNLQATGNPHAAHDTSAMNLDTRRVLELQVLNIFVRRISYRNGGYRHRNGYKPLKVKVGGATGDDYSGITHPLLRNPEKIGSVLWNRDSSLIIARSNDHIQHARGDTLHIEAYNQENAIAFVQYMRQLAPDGHVQILEIAHDDLSKCFALGVS